MSSSYQNEAELELGLGLSLRSCGGGGCGGGGVVKAKESPPFPWGEHEYVKIMTAKDFPSSVAGTKRGADCVCPQELGYSACPVTSQIVGWPPIRTHRMNSLINQTKSANANEEDEGLRENNTSKDILKKKITNGRNNNGSSAKERGHIGFVKVNMDGLPIGRKVDLSAHACYETLAQTIEEMFFKPSTTINSIRQASKLLDGSSEFVLTYEDKEGDWMLVGDVPWGMFLSTAKRLRIMKTSEANGLAPRFQERHDRRKS